MGSPISGSKIGPTRTSLLLAPAIILQHGNVDSFLRSMTGQGLSENLSARTIIDISKLLSRRYGRKYFITFQSFSMTVKCRKIIQQYMVLYVPFVSTMFVADRGLLQAATALPTYRSDIGKAGLTAMDEIWDSEGMKGSCVTKEQRKAWVERQLEKKIFLYIDMESVVRRIYSYYGPMELTSILNTCYRSILVRSVGLWLHKSSHFISNPS